MLEESTCPSLQHLLHRQQVRRNLNSALLPCWCTQHQHKISLCTHPTPHTLH